LGYRVQAAKAGGSDEVGTHRSRNPGQRRTPSAWPARQRVPRYSRAAACRPGYPAGRAAVVLDAAIRWRADDGDDHPCNRAAFVNADDSLPSPRLRRLSPGAWRRRADRAWTPGSSSAARSANEYAFRGW